MGKPRMGGKVSAVKETRTLDVKVAEDLSHGVTSGWANWAEINSLLIENAELRVECKEMKEKIEEMTVEKGALLTTVASHELTIVHLLLSQLST